MSLNCATSMDEVTHLPAFHDWLKACPAAALRLISRQRDVGSTSLAELQGSEVPVNAVFNGLKFIVGFGFRDTAVGDDHDLVHVPHVASRRAIINDVRPRIRLSRAS